MMVGHLKHEGTSHSSSDLLKIFVKMGASWSARVLRQAGDTLSGPGSFLLLFSLKTWHTSSSLIFSAGVGDSGVAGDVNGCVERCSGQVWRRGGLLEVFRAGVGCFSKSTVKPIKIVCQLLILQSAGG